MNYHNCFGCQITAGAVHIPGGDIWRDNEWQVGHDPKNVIPGFIVVGTIKHIKTITEIPDASLCFGFQLISESRRLLEAHFGLKKYITFQNDRTDGHYHIGLLPIYPEMEQFGGTFENIIPFLKWTKKAWNTPEKLEQINVIAATLREGLRIRFRSTGE